MKIRPLGGGSLGLAEAEDRRLRAEAAQVVGETLGSMETLSDEQVSTSNHERTQALPSWLEYYNHQRRHTSLGRRPPISRVSPT